jgi:hypothetical protein
MGFNFVTFWLGLLALGALALMREPAPWPGSRVLGAVLAAALAAYVV